MDLPKHAKVDRLFTLPMSTELFRVHDERFSGTAFNPCMGKATRFTHLSDEGGNCIPTAYAATTLDGAAYETVFRGTPNKYQSTPRQMLDDRTVSSLSLVTDLILVPLFTPELRKWEIEAEEFFKSTNTAYVTCRALCFRVWRDNPTAQGIIWSSVQDSGAQAMLLFGDRVEQSALTLISSKNVRTDHTALDALEDAGSRAGWTITK